MRQPGSLRPVWGHTAIARTVVTVCVVVTMLAIAAAALKLGMRSQEARADLPGPSVSAPAHAPSAAAPAPTSSTPVPSQSTALPVPVTKTPAKPTRPSNPADLGVLVSKDFPLNPTSYTPAGLVNMQGSQLRGDVAKALRKMIADAKKDGHKLSLLSGYRSAAEQAALHEQYVSRSGQEEADRFSAKAGFSEHQTGLSADIGNGTCDLSSCFGDTAAGKWVAKNASNYGFIVRYPKGKEAVTGYIWEPWHLRYLGATLTKKYIASDASTLEAYYGEAK